MMLYKKDIISFYFLLNITTLEIYMPIYIIKNKKIYRCQIHYEIISPTYKLALRVDFIRNLFLFNRLHQGIISCWNKFIMEYIY